MLRLRFAVLIMLAVLLRRSAVVAFRGSARLALAQRLLRTPRVGRGGAGGHQQRGAGLSWLQDVLLGRKIDDEDLSLKSEVDPGNVKGTKLKILKYPNPKLRTENALVTEFNAELEQKAREMLLVMYAADGIGLAAPQVGLNTRLMVFNEVGDASKQDKEMILVNPTIVAKSEEKDLRDEGCLSFPLINGKVERHIWIEVEYQALSGEKVLKRFDGFPARIFQHEYDHLEKVLFIDRLVPEDKTMNQKRLDKYVKKYGPGGLP